MNTKSLLAAAAFMALAVGSTAAKADLIQNGGFETGDNSGWTINADHTGTAPSGFVGITAHSGNYFMALGDTAEAYPYGTVSVATPISDHAGDTLTLSYWFLNQSDGANYFDAEWNGAVLSGSVLADVGPMDWTQYQFSVLATGSDVLTFREQNVPAFSALDDVSLVVSQVAPPPAVPEPASLSLFGLALAAVGLKRRRA
jgi:hypothetical protein